MGVGSEYFGCSVVCAFSICVSFLHSFFRNGTSAMPGQTHAHVWGLEEEEEEEEEGVKMGLDNPTELFRLIRGR